VNPFTPGKRLTRPDIFAGRTEQLENGIALLRQAAGGNVRHGLITGDRGIGKSSLLSQVEGIATRDERYVNAMELTEDELPGYFLVAEHIAQIGEQPGDVAAGLLRSLDRARGRGRRKVRLENVGVDLKFVKANITAQEPSKSIAERFVDQLEQVWKNVNGEVDGIVLAIDEVDRVAEVEGMASFLKVSTEMLSSRELEHIALVPVGVVGVQELLKAEHKSVGRVFEVITVPKLSNDEATSIVTRALTGTGVQIKPEVNGRIAELSGGFPHPVHLLGSETFEADTDDMLDEADLEAGVKSVVAEKWKEEFDQSYIEAGSGKNRQIVKAMASYDGTDVAVAYISDVLGAQQPEYSSNIGELMKRGVILRADRGVYRFRDPLFRHYVQHLDVLGEEPAEVRPRRRGRKP
jgi:AAA ATPase domain